MEKKLLGLIVTLALILRLVFLGSIPQGFTPDEAAQGYTAYSIWLTGHDEWNQLPSLTGFKSYLDYKAPLLTYLMIPSVGLFGLNEFAVRLPSALVGTLAVVALYFTVNKLFPDLKLKLKKRELSVGLIAAAALAVSPWHLQFSRMALEANLISLFFPAGLYCFLRASKESKYLLGVSIFWGLSLYSYHAAKLFVPFFVIAAFVWNLKTKTKVWQNSLIAIVIFILFLIPIGLDTIWGSSGKRGGDLLITKLNTDQLHDISQTRFYSPLGTVSTILPRLLHNRLNYSLDKTLENYISYYSPTFWFTEGGREITYSIIPGRGLLWLWQFPFVFVGLYWLAKNYKTKRQVALIFAWILLAALPAALTQEGYRPNRASAFLGVWEMTAAIGVIYFFNHLTKYRVAIATTLTLIVLASFISYLDDYAFASQVHFPRALSYGWREAVHFTNVVENQYSHVYVERGNESQMMVAFYTPILPSEYQKYAQEWQKTLEADSSLRYLDQMPQYRLGKYSFTSWNWNQKYDKEGLYLAYSPDQLPANRHTLHQVKAVTGEVLMEIFDFRL